MNRRCEGEVCVTARCLALVPGVLGGACISCSRRGAVFLALFFSVRSSLSLSPRERGLGGPSAGDFLVLPDLTYLQFSAMDALAGMMMKGAAKCDKHAE